MCQPGTKLIITRVNLFVAEQHNGTATTTAAAEGGGEECGGGRKKSRETKPHATAPGAKSEKSLGALLRQQPESAERAEELAELEQFANAFKKQRIKHGTTGTLISDLNSLVMLYGLQLLQVSPRAMSAPHLANATARTSRKQVRLWEGLSLSFLTFFGTLGKSNAKNDQFFMKKAKKIQNFFLGGPYRGTSC